MTFSLAMSTDATTSGLRGSWSISGPFYDGPRPFWTWSAVGPGAGEGGEAATKDRAVELAEASFKRLNP